MPHLVDVVFHSVAHSNIFASCMMRVFSKNSKEIDDYLEMFERDGRVVIERVTFDVAKTRQSYMAAFNEASDSELYFNMEYSKCGP